MTRRVVITGLGLVSPLGNTPSQLWDALLARRSGIRPLSCVATEALPVKFGGEAEFTGAIEEFGPLDKAMSRNIKKNLKVMCREMQMGIAVAQLALTDARLVPAALNLDRIGCVYGSDYMVTLPGEFTEAVRNCLGERGEFDFNRWAEKGLTSVEPLWLLKYLPNLPASHIGIFNDLHGPNNSITMREASSNLALAEAYATIVRGHADAMIAGATGTKVHPTRTIHVVLQEEVAVDGDDPAKLSRPFDLHRRGGVIGEGAAAVILEELEHAQVRGATILAEVIGCGASASATRQGVGQIDRAVRLALEQALRASGQTPDQIGHVHAHGASTRKSDAQEAQGIATVFGGRKAPLPVVAAKSNFGNLGAAGGMVELIASVLATRHGRLFPALNYDTPDPECPVALAQGNEVPAGNSFINLSVTPQGQASAVVVRGLA